MDTRFLEAALGYAEMGIRVFPCIPRTKRPLVPAWQKAATTDAEQIEAWWTKWPDANIAAPMGEGSGIIDAECDSQEEEGEYVNLFGGEPPATASFLSSVDPKSGYPRKHFLLAWRDDLPGGATVDVGKLRVRLGAGGKGAYSILPPSIHPDTGKPYEWLAHPDDVPPAAIPDEVVPRFSNWQGGTAAQSANEAGVGANGGGNGAVKSDDEWEKILDGVEEGSRNNDMASYCGWLLRQASDLRSRKAVRNLYQTAQAINERNKPPLADKELKTIFRSIMSKEVQRRATADADDVLPDAPDEATEPARPAGGFRLIIVHSEPRTYELYAPQFKKSPGSFLRLDAKQMNSPASIRVQALEQADYPLPKTFDKAWSRRDGLYERCVFHAEHREAPPEEVRPAVIAEQLLSVLSKARPLLDAEKPDSSGHPCRMEDGSVIFLFTPVWSDLNWGPDRITRPELSRVLKEVGVTTLEIEKRKWKKLSPEALVLLKDRWARDEGG